MQNEANELLNKAKELLKSETTPISYDTWIRELEIQSITNNSIVLIAKSDFHKEAIDTRYHDLIVNTFNFITSKNCTLTVLSKESMTLNNDIKPTYTENNNNLQENNSITNLNPKYTFDTFVIGSNNRFAHAAAYAVAESPATAYNPLFIYGGAGLGKTHLMHSIGNEIKKRNPAAKILYVTSEKFTNQLINAIKDNTNEKFRTKYREIDVLLIDDIQFIQGKESVQEEFFHTFNALHESNKQIIISSDRPPKDMQIIEDRLRSRFEWGLIADISSADYETRYAILRKKADMDNLIIDEEVLSNIATKVDSNIRELEGVLNKIVAYASLTHSPITYEMAERAINDVIAQKEKVISSDYIQEIVSKYFDIERRDLKSSKRSNDIAYPRQIAMYLCRDIAQMPFTKIGEEFGKRDHTTVMHAVNKIEKDLKENANTKLIVDSVKNLILNTK